MKNVLVCFLTNIFFQDISIGAPPSIPLDPPTYPPIRPTEEGDEEEEGQFGAYRSPVYSPRREDSQESNGDWDERRGGHSSPSYSMEETLPTYKYEFPTPRTVSNERKRWDEEERTVKEERHEVWVMFIHSFFFLFHQIQCA